MDWELERRKVESRLEILDAVVWATEHGRELLDLVGVSETVEDARRALMQSYGFTELTATAILDTQVRRWSRLETQRLRDEQQELRARLRELTR
jgi:DNA gyrase subunit A